MILFASKRLITFRDGRDQTYLQCPDGLEESKEVIYHKIARLQLYMAC
jgi:hypothetical protein